MKKWCFLLAFGICGWPLWAGFQVGIDVGPNRGPYYYNKGYYYDDGYYYNTWYGPGWYYGNYYGDYPAYYGGRPGFWGGGYYWSGRRHGRHRH